MPYFNHCEVLNVNGIQSGLGPRTLNLNSTVLLPVLSALAWGETGGKDCSDIPGGLDDVADAIVIVSCFVFTDLNAKCL